MTEFIVRTAEETHALGRRLARHLQAGDLVVLTGGLGAGKTTFTQGVGAGLDVAGQIASPTFVIARTHPPVSGGPGLVHVDAYRLQSLDEVDALELDTDLEDSIPVVDWGEGMVAPLSPGRRTVEIHRPRGAERDLDDDTPTITIFGHGPRWAENDLDET